jgi:hypothetical protein
MIAVVLLFLLPINGLILVGIIRQKTLLETEKRAKLEAYQNLFRFRNWRDR